MQYTLTNESIDNACEEVGQFLNKGNTPSKEVIRVKLGVEEVLLSYQKTFGEEAVFMLNMGSRFGKDKIRVVVPGESYDPFTSYEYSTDEDDFMRKAMVRMGKAPQWQYRRRANEVMFTSVRRTAPDWLKLLTAIVSAVVLGLLTKLSPESVRVVLQHGIIEPLINTFLGFLNAVAGPMIFLSVVWGIYSIGDATTFSDIGKKLLQKFGLFLCVTTIICVILSMPFFTLNFGNAQTGGDFSSLYQMVLDIIPSNLFTPFSRGNTLQILFVAIIVGIAVLIIGKDTQGVMDLSEQLGLIVNGIMNVISKLVPFFVFGSLFNIIVSSEFHLLMTGGKFSLGSLIGCFIVLLFHTIAGCIIMKMSPVTLWKKLSSTFIIAVTTASSSAAFSDNLNTCIDKLGVSPRIANFGVPFGQILYKPSPAILFWFAAVSTAESSGVEISINWIITAVVMCIIISAAAPPVPGGMSASFAILFSQLNLPIDNLAVILSLTSILDFIVTASNLFSVQVVLGISEKRK